MCERYTEKARVSSTLLGEAIEFGAPLIATEHLLRGL
jgi:hypothetical protein